MNVCVCNIHVHAPRYMFVCKHVYRSVYVCAMYTKDKWGNVMD